MTERHLVVSSQGYGKGSVTLDGVELASSIRGLSITWSAGNSPVLDLDPVVVTADVEHRGDVAVRIPTATHDALVALGWTPPAPDPGGG